ncbi:hypothetical protein FRC10_005619 [Ceratobasidium sp. 414]|nr:hypothetical protein FRC10_005619 [Ceratobasidium sp. 414]
MSTPDTAVGVAKRKAAHEPPVTTTLSQLEWLLLRAHMHHRPHLTLRDLCDKLLAEGVLVSPFRLFGLLRENDIQAPLDDCWLNWNRPEREEFALKVGKFDIGQLVFIVQISDGPARPQSYTSVINHTIQRTKSPLKEKSLVILNKNWVEDMGAVVSVVESSGMKCLFLPPISPDFDPSREAIDWIKDAVEVRKEIFGTASSKQEVEGIVYALVVEITGEQALEWLRDSNYV